MHNDEFTDNILTFQPSSRRKENLGEKHPLAQNIYVIPCTFGRLSEDNWKQECN